jgi:cyclophilin family peptidyl-prolyl cis-trans isomerase
MQKIVWVLGAVVIVVIVFFLFGTKPVPKAEDTGNKEVKVNTGSTVPGKNWPKAPQMSIDQNKTYTATITTSKGAMNVNLFAKEVPNTVNNFVFLASQKFYDGVVFHRIIKDFMVQTGDPKGDGTGGPGYAFADEAVTRDYTKGIVAMANSGPNTNGSQFFIMTGKNDLPKNYTIFGTIDANDSESLITLDAIANTPVTDNGQGETSKPTEEVKITSVTTAEK